MKFFLAWLFSPVLYGIGHMFSVVMHWPMCSRLYFFYNNLMCWSIDLEDRAGVEIMWHQCPSYPCLKCEKREIVHGE